MVNHIEFFMGEVHMLHVPFESDSLVLIVVIEDSPIVLSVVSINQNWLLRCTWLLG